ncbi:hypothetical protein B7R22_17270 [Subtercola boreus]|uniref:Uncharacterized protein n=1 Tax=Subtercola boreus TaxID=120213 RepID=A0A3E0VRW0_9MICO|nr:hypothetical protein [Subtercola boreus]RFA12178.1 hypothetical protein B7R22_17270 [Subtercola boreus]
MPILNGSIFAVGAPYDATSPWKDSPDLFETITSDLFSGGNATDINGRTLDAGFGDDNVPRMWTANVAAAFAIVAGALTRGTNSASGQATFPCTVADVEFGYTVTQLPAANGNAFYADIRLNLAAGAAGARSSYRMTLINRAGVVYVEMYRRTNASTLIGAGSTYIVAVGDTISIRASGNKIQLLRNDILLETTLDVTADFHPTGSFCGFESGTAAGFAIDNVYAEKYLGPAPAAA